MALAITTIGAIVTVWQVIKARKAAEAAQAATIKTRQEITRNVALSDASGAVKSLEEVKTLLRTVRFEAALLRVTDVIAQLSQMQHLDSAPGGSELREILTQLSILQDQLERSLQDPTASVDSARANKIIARIAHRLNTWIGERKYLHDGGNEDD